MSCVPLERCVECRVERVRPAAVEEDAVAIEVEQVAERSARERSRERRELEDRRHRARERSTTAQIKGPDQAARMLRERERA